MAPTPLALCGKSATMATTFSSAISSQSKNAYTITHVCHSLDSALTELPPLLKGEAVTPSSDLSVPFTTDSKQPIPKAVVIGKGFSQDEMDEIVKTVGDKRVLFLLPDDAKFSWGMVGKAVLTAGTGLPGVIAERVIKALEEHGTETGGTIGF